MRDDLVSKLSQVIEQIPKDVLYDFLCSYAQEHEELAMALVSEFWHLLLNREILRLLLLALLLSSSDYSNSTPCPNHPSI